nr:hypothetical protein CFP56_08019 [Quercus suber]
MPPQMPRDNKKIRKQEVAMMRIDEGVADLTRVFGACHRTGQLRLSNVLVTASDVDHSFPAGSNKFMPEPVFSRGRPSPECYQSANDHTMLCCEAVILAKCICCETLALTQGPCFRQLARIELFAEAGHSVEHATCGWVHIVLFSEVAITFSYSTSTRFERHP